MGTPADTCRVRKERVPSELALRLSSAPHLSTASSYSPMFYFRVSSTVLLC